MKGKNSRRSQRQQSSNNISFKNKDIVIDSILEETKFLTEQEEMERNAERFRNKEQMDEIFSNTSMQRRVKNQSPLDEEINAEATVDSFDKKQKTENSHMIDDSTSTTLEAVAIMDSPNADEATYSNHGEDLNNNGENADKLQENLQESCPVEEDTIVTLKPEFESGTTIAKDVIEEVEQFNVQPLNIKDVDSIDIDIADDGEFETVVNEENQEETRTLDDFKANDVSENEENLSNYERIFGKPKPISAEVTTIVSKVPVYRHESKVEQLQVKAGKFSEIVRSEYEQYLKSKNPVISQSNKPVADEVDELSVKAINDKLVGKVVEFFANEGTDQQEQPEEETAVTVDDYTEPDDAKSVITEININIRKLFFRSVIMGAILFLSLVFTIVLRAFEPQLEQAVPAAPVVFSLANLVLVAFSMIVCHTTIFSGLSPLIKIKGNSDTALAVGSIAIALQSIVSLFAADDFFKGTQSYFSITIILGFFANTFGKLTLVRRVKDNFKFVAAKAPAYCAKIYTNEAIAAKLLSGTVVGKPIVAYQHKTDFLSNFLKLSYSPDPSEDMAAKIAPFTTLVSVTVGIIYGVMFKSFVGAVSAYALVAAVSVPVCDLLAANVPMRSLCKKLLRRNAMISGYQSVKQFCDTACVMVDASELYPVGNITLNGIKTFSAHKIDASILAAAAVMKEAGSPMATIFDNLLSENKRTVPKVESVLYEDSMGLVGWVNGERILVGSSDLLEKYGVDSPSSDYEEKYRSQGRKITYLAQSGQLIAMFVTTYEANISIAQELQRAESNGISILVRTTDCNITSELIAQDFGIFYRTVKVLPTGLGNVCKEATEQKDESSRAYLATRGKLTSLLRGLSGCVRIKGNIYFAVVIQLIAVIMGVVLVTALSLYSGVGTIKTVEILLFVLFWAAASIVAPLIKKP